MAYAHHAPCWWSTLTSTPWDDARRRIAVQWNATDALQALHEWACRGIGMAKEDPLRVSSYRCLHGATA